MGARIANLLITLTNIALSLIGLFLGLRIVLRFLSANPSTPVVSWIYSASSFIMTPFQNLFSDLQTGVGVLDIVAITALVIYMLAGYLLSELFRNLATIDEEVAPSTVHYHEVDEDLEEEEKPKHHYRRRVSRR